jgi:superfamily II RNA helicase
VVPAWWEPELMGLVHAWASGTSWVDVIANTSLDEGDVVRILRRTVDLLAQVPYAEALSEQLRTTARKALKAINRFPVCEVQDLCVTSSNPSTTTHPSTSTQDPPAE